MQANARVPWLMRGSLVAAVALLVPGLWFVKSTRVITPECASDVDRATLEAALTGNWREVADALATVTPDTPSSVPRLLKAHACLALNRNNEALCLFQSVTGDDLGMWLEWGDYAAKRYKRSSAAHYFAGDAHARLGEWDAAVEAYTLALKLDPDDALALDARGVAYAMEGDWAIAISDLETAIQRSPGLADAYANRGFVNIHKGDGLEGAARWFDEALRVDPDCAVALIGRGCARILLNEWEAAQCDLSAANGATSGAMPLVLDALLAAQAYMSGVTKDDLVAWLSGQAPGTTLARNYADCKDLLGQWMDEPTQHNYNKLLCAVGSLSPEQQQAFKENHLRPALEGNPELAATAAKQNSEVKRWNEGLGGMVGDLLGGVTAGVGAFLVAAGEVLAKGIGAILIGGGQVAEGRFRNWRDDSLEAADTMDDLMPDRGGQPPGGVDMSLAGAWDEGEWPFAPYYGLCYHRA